MKFIFRADASIEIGSGHVMRCLTLAETLRSRGGECQFVTRNLKGHLGNLILERGFAVAMLSAPSESTLVTGPPAHANWAKVSWEQDLSETCAVFSAADWLVLDHYSFDKRWERGLGDRVKQIMVIDDLADRPHCASVLLDQNLGRKACDYDDLVSGACRRLIGPRFALLRPEFSAYRKQSLARRNGRDLSHLMISMGGTDVVNATSAILQALATANLCADLRFTVVMGGQAPALDRVRDLAAQLPWPIKVLVDVRDMAALMVEADLAIGAAGSTTWERCCLGLPSIIVQTAANQAGAMVAMHQAGAAITTDSLLSPAFDESLAMAVRQLLTPEINVKISQVSSQLCFGQGSAQTAQLMQESVWA